MRYENKHFVNQKVDLDGNGFINCKFEKCELVFKGIEPCGAAEGCLFLNTTLAFVGPAANTLTMLSNLYAGGFNNFVEKLFENIRSNQPQGGLPFARA